MSSRPDFDQNNEVPIDVMNRVLDMPQSADPSADPSDEDYDSSPVPAPDAKAMHALNIQLEKVMDEVSGMHESLNILDTRLNNLEEFLKGKDESKRIDRHIDRIENALAEIKTKMREEISVFDKDVIRAMFDNIDEKLKVLHKENLKRKEEYAEIGDVVANRNIKWALVFSAAFSCLSAFLIVILSMILR